MTELTRRNLMKYAGVGAGATAVGMTVPLGQTASTKDWISTAPKPACFARPLPVPAPLRPRRMTDRFGAYLLYEISARAGSAQVLDPGAPRTPVFGYGPTAGGASVPGPLLKVPQHIRTCLRVRNELPPTKGGPAACASTRRGTAGATRAAPVGGTAMHSNPSTPVPCRRPRWCALALAVVAAALAVAWPAAAEAHSDLVGSTPQAAEQVALTLDRLVLEFGEEVVADSADVVVLDAAGRDVVTGEASSLGTTVEVPVVLTEAGRHEASYRVTSVDGHVVVGDLAFTAVAGDPAFVPGLAGAGEGSEAGGLPGGVVFVVSAVVVLGLVVLVRVASRRPATGDGVVTAAHEVATTEVADPGGTPGAPGGKARPTGPGRHRPLG